ncbi:MAG: phenylalanine--tRNA ligase subunit alpha, partial [Euryarchaeota archaeon]|nr:phenylalanine--tRNA ligase subunit alpha [Euryarchaeota archaeon]
MAQPELSRNERRVLLALRGKGPVPPEQVLGAGGFSQLVEVMSAASWLRSKGLLEIHERMDTSCLLDREGREHLERGELPEFSVLKALGPSGRREMSELGSGGLSREQVRIALGWMKRKGWASLTKQAGRSIASITEEGRKRLEEGPDTEEMRLLRAVAAAGEGGLPESEAKRISAHALSLLVTRKGLLKSRERHVRTLELTAEGEALAASGLSVGGEITQLTPEIIQSGKWKDAEIRPYDVHTFAPAMHGGKGHVLREAIERIRDIFLHMGFTEIAGDYIESCFWNMDVLFIPQDHPARDAQDTFYMKSPGPAELPAGLVEVVRRIHETGGETGSEGWRYRWSEEEARRTLLRTHTTVNTIRYLSEHPDRPCKVFSVGKVFRREATDNRHLAEFHQIEGIVMEEGGSFRMLIGVIREFYSRMGFSEVR